MRAAAFLTLFMALTTTAQEEPAEQMGEDAKALEGKWEIVSSEFEGQPATNAYRPGTVIVIEGGELYFADGFANSSKEKFQLDALTDPKSIDLGAGGDKVVKGIYSLDKDALKLCLNLEGRRPKEFKTKAGDKTNLLVLKRELAKR